MSDTSNWEFAAAVAAICIGLGGLLLFTMLGAIGGWRMYNAATGASAEVMRAAAAMQDLALAMMAAQATERTPSIDLLAQAEELSTLRRRTAELLEEQRLLQDAVKNLVEAGVLQGEESQRQLREVEQALRTIEEHFIRLTTPGGR